MNEKVRKSLPTKLSAIGFIVMILLGNYWFVLVLTQQSFPQWLMNAFLLTAFFLVGCAASVLYVSLRSVYDVPSGDDDEPEQA